MAYVSRETVRPATPCGDRPSLVVTDEGVLDA